MKRDDEPRRYVSQDRSDSERTNLKVDRWYWTASASELPPDLDLRVGMRESMLVVRSSSPLSLSTGPDMDP